jgi:c-di-GMP-related signal transduction protein
MFEHFIAGHSILRDNLTLLGYNLAFRPVTPGVVPPQPAPSAAYTIDAATMVYSWESLVGSYLAFIPCQIHELLSGAALLLPRTRSVH